LHLGLNCSWIGLCSRRPDRYRECRSRESGPQAEARGWVVPTIFFALGATVWVGGKAGFAALLRRGFLLAACKGSVSASLSAEGAAELPASPLAPPHRFAFGEGKSVGGADCEAAASRRHADAAFQPLAGEFK
jgi:hypothetical protein